MMPVMSEEERCRLCGCQLNRSAGAYGGPTTEGRSGASEHHFVAERFFGRSRNRRGVKTAGIFTALSSPWGDERQSDIFCYECHELLLHNPVLLREDIDRFTELVRMRNLAETVKPADYSKIASRVVLFHEVIARGLELLHGEETERAKSRGI